MSQSWGALNRIWKTEQKLTNHGDTFCCAPKRNQRDTSEQEASGWLERICTLKKISPQNSQSCNSLCIHLIQNDLKSVMLKHFQFVGVRVANGRGCVIQGADALSASVGVFAWSEVFFPFPPFSLSKFAQLHVNEYVAESLRFSGFHINNWKIEEPRIQFYLNNYLIWKTKLLFKHHLTIY